VAQVRPVRFTRGNYSKRVAVALPSRSIDLPPRLFFRDFGRSPRLLSGWFQQKSRLDEPVIHPNGVQSRRSEELRGFGLGERLVDAVVKEAKRIGYHEIRLDILPSMAGAIALYRKLAFEPIQPYYEAPMIGTIFIRRSFIERRGTSVPAQYENQGCNAVAMSRYSGYRTR
jgi:GNAT superfamily N-acetyltransferase